MQEFHIHTGLSIRVNMSQRVMVVLHSPAETPKGEFSFLQVPNDKMCQSRAQGYLCLHNYFEVQSNSVSHKISISATHLFSNAALHWFPLQLRQTSSWLSKSMKRNVKRLNSEPTSLPNRVATQNLLVYHPGVLYLQHRQQTRKKKSTDVNGPSCQFNLPNYFFKEC